MKKKYKLKDYRFDNFMLNVDTYMIDRFEAFLNQREYQKLSRKEWKLRNCSILDDTLSEEQEEIYY